MAAPTIQRGAFHWAHGITFQRINDRGDVLIGFGGLTFIVPAAQWGSIIASVTPEGDSAMTYAAAERFHNGL